MTASVLQLNQPVWVSVRHAEREVRGVGYVSGLDNGEVRIAFPDMETVPSEFAISAAAVLKLLDIVGVHQAETTIKRIADGEPSIVVSMPAGFENTQNRKFLRVPTRSEITFSVTKSENPANVSQKNVTVMMNDISAMGLRFESETPLLVGDEVTVDVPMLNDKENRSLHASGRVMWLITVGPNAFSVGIQFNELGAVDQARLMSHLFELQRPGV